MKDDQILVEGGIAELADLFVSSQDVGLVRDFLHSILTPAEAQDVAKRWELVKKLKAGETQRAIAGDLHISLCKITRGSRELKKDNSAFARMLDLLGEKV